MHGQVAQVRIGNGDQGLPRLVMRIGEQIGDIQNATNSAVASIREITTTISEINEISASTAQAIEQQTEATREIASNVE